MNSGSKVGPFEIVRLLGKGGMGEVYLARDTRLGRDVALKVLPAEFAQARERLRRFEQEAKTLASVNHPNILSIFEVGAHEGAPYLVSELLNGETLRERLQRGPISERKAVEMTLQIARGLAAAHDKGVVHRDLKPENLFVTKDERLKILDFGLAKLKDPSPALRAPSPLGGERDGVRGPSVADDAPTLVESTEPGRVMGTVGYMSPEQVRGKPADHRSDLFSVGAILFEMLTGQRAFQRGTAAETMTAILKEEPGALAEAGRTVSQAWQRIVRRCLEKSPERRFQSASDLAFAIEAITDSNVALPAATRSAEIKAPRSARALRLGIAAGLAVLALAAIIFIYPKLKPDQSPETTPGQTQQTPSRRRIAVLPLRSVSAEEQNQIFSEGMTAELLGKLSKIKGLVVIDGTSFIRYKGTGKDDAEIGKELSVEALLKGSVLRDAGRVRILLQLIDVGSQAILWPYEYEKQLQDGGQVFAIASEAAEGVASALRVGLGADERQQLASKPTANLEAYDLYNRGRYYWARRTSDSLRQAIDVFNQAAAKDPNFALGYAGLADTYAVLAYYADVQPQESFPLGLKAAHRAIELDPSLAEPHAALGWIKANYEWDWAGSEREFLESIKLNPDWPTAHAWFGIVLSAQGRHPEGNQQMREATRLAPHSPLMNALHGFTLYFAHDLTAAEKQLKATLDLEPNYAFARQWHGEVMLGQGRFAEAIKELSEASRLGGGTHGFRGALGRACGLGGQRAEAQQILEELKRLATANPAAGYDIAMICAGLGDKPQALEWLEKGVAAKAYQTFHLKNHPAFTGLHSEERFQRLLKQVGLNK